MTSPCEYSQVPSFNRSHVGEIQSDGETGSVWPFYLTVRVGGIEGGRKIWTGYECSRKRQAKLVSLAAFEVEDVSEE